MSLQDSLRSAMGQGRTYRSVHINDIRSNDNNFYNVSGIAELADLIEKNGANAGRVYEEDLGDGKHFTLIGGHQRFQALRLLESQGRCDGMFYVRVEPKPASEEAEMLAIIEDNLQREKTPDVRKKEVDTLSTIYDKWKAEDAELEDAEKRIKTGVAKRDWIASKIGITGRQVQEYLTGDFSANADEGESQESSSESQPRQRVEPIGAEAVQKAIQKACKAVRNAIKKAEAEEMDGTSFELQRIHEQLENIQVGGVSEQ